MTSFEDRVARIAKKHGTPMAPASAGGVPMAYSAQANDAPDQAEESEKLRKNLNKAGRSAKFVALFLGGILGMIAGLMFQQFIGFDRLNAMSFGEHVAHAINNPTYLFAWIAILLGPVLFSLLAAFRTDAIRLTQFAGLYFGTSLGINFAMAVQNAAN